MHLFRMHACVTQYVNKKAGITLVSANDLEVLSVSRNGNIVQQHFFFHATSNWEVLSSCKERSTLLFACKQTVSAMPVAWKT